MKKIVLKADFIEQLIEINEDSEVEGIFIIRNDEDINLKLKVVHKKPSFKSRVNIKAVVYGNSKFNLDCLVRVEKGAFDTDTYLKVDCLVIGDRASARAIPSLEILENSVRAGHGATIGYLDQSMMAYLMGKGLSKKQSENLLVKAFIGKSY